MDVDGQTLCTCTRNLSLCLVPISQTNTSLASHLSAGVSSQIFDMHSLTLNAMYYIASMQQTLTSVTLFTAVVPVVPVVIPLAIDCDFMVTFSQPTLNTAVIANNTSNNTNGNTKRIHNTIVRRANHKTTIYIYHDFILFLQPLHRCILWCLPGAHLCHPAPQCGHVFHCHKCAH